MLNPTLEVTPLTSIEKQSSDTIQFLEVKINKAYRTAWNITRNNYVCIVKDGALLSDHLYRFADNPIPDFDKQNYFLIRKSIEATYSSNVMRIAKHVDSNYLKEVVCILDKKGNQIGEFSTMSIIHLLPGGNIYTIENEYFNTKTGERYGKADKRLESLNHIFIKLVDSNKVVKIEKATGLKEIIN